MAGIVSGLISGWRRVTGWLRERSPQEKLMLVLIVVLLVCVALRWAWVKREAGDAFRQRLEHFQTPDGRADTLPISEAYSPEATISEADPGGWNVVGSEAEL